MSMELSEWHVSQLTERVHEGTKRPKLRNRKHDKAFLTICSTSHYNCQFMHVVNAKFLSRQQGVTKFAKYKTRKCVEGKNREEFWVHNLPTCGGHTKTRP
jgi:hypothetical protein